MTSERDRALNQAIEFIAREYCDPSLEPNGEWLPPEARKVHADLIAALTPSTQAPGAFAVGDLVEKSRGYLFPGIVDAVFRTQSGEVRYVIEHRTSKGLLHIFNEEQLAPPAAPPRSLPSNGDGK